MPKQRSPFKVCDEASVPRMTAGRHGCIHEAAVLPRPRSALRITVTASSFRRSRIAVISSSI
jgi:hypothetical protein